MSSAYFKSLRVEDQQRYLAKLKPSGAVHLPDPYDTRNSHLFSDDKLLYPSVSWPELHDYLVNTPGKFTRERLKSYKSLEAYNYFLSGKVRNVTTYQPTKVPRVRLVRCDVVAGQKENTTYAVWIVAEDSGTVTSAHCTCMAG